MWEEIALHRILPRLPSKSLMRFKCVRKSWYTLINNPTFVENHLSISMHSKLSTCILFNRFVQSDPNPSEKELAFSFLYRRNDYDDAEHNVNFVVEDMKFPLSSGRFIGLKVIESPRIIGHCDGVICLSDSSGNVFLCNPAINEIKLLPESFLPDWWYCAVGFGYDPKSKDYKVSRIATYQAEIDGLIPPPRVEIYTLSTDSWREIKNNSLETEATVFFPDYFQIYFQGICYWMGYEQPKQSVEYEDEEQKPMVIFLDTGDEIFHHILFPDSFYMYEEGSAYAYEMSYIMYTDLRIILWNGSIALFGINRFSALPESYGVWVLDDFEGTKGSWTKHLTFDPLKGIERVLEFWKPDEIMVTEADGDIVLYNLETKKLKKLYMNIPSDFETIVYVNSLVPITGGNKVEYKRYGVLTKANDKKAAGNFQTKTPQTASMKVEFKPYTGNENFTLWQRITKLVLMQQHLNVVLVGKRKKSETMTDEEWDTLAKRPSRITRRTLTSAINKLHDTRTFKDGNCCEIIASAQSAKVI